LVTGLEGEVACFGVDDVVAEQCASGSPRRRCACTPASGPGRTTVSAAAREADVQRSTVYRHFPTEVDLFGACSQHWFSLNPPPDPGAWRKIADPGERLRAALGELYQWYGWAEPMLVNVMRDDPLVPAMERPVQVFLVLLAQMQDALLRGRRERGRARRRAAAAIMHALAFETWHSLVRQGGLDDSEAVMLMVPTVEAAGRPDRATVQRAAATPVRQETVG
jgi:AcrR family transcriptional regulator